MEYHDGRFRMGVPSVVGPRGEQVFEVRERVDVDRLVRKKHDGARVGGRLHAELCRTCETARTEVRRSLEEGHAPEQRDDLEGSSSPLQPSIVVMLARKVGDDLSKPESF